MKAFKPLVGNAAKVDGHLEAHALALIKVVAAAIMMAIMARVAAEMTTNRVRIVQHVARIAGIQPIKQSVQPALIAGLPSQRAAVNSSQINLKATNSKVISQEAIGRGTIDSGMRHQKRVSSSLASHDRISPEIINLNEISQKSLIKSDPLKQDVPAQTVISREVHVASARAKTGRMKTGRIKIGHAQFALTEINRAGAMVHLKSVFLAIVRQKVQKVRVNHFGVIAAQAVGTVKGLHLKERLIKVDNAPQMAAS